MKNVDDSFKKIIPKIKYHFKNIYSVNNKKFSYGCGSYLFNGKKYEYDNSMYEKQKLLYNISKKSNNVLEIGVYMGHSLLIMLMANPKINITCIDINNTYPINSVNYLKKKFPKAKINLIINDSLKALNKINKKFDLFHIDGDHSIGKIYKEILFCFKNKKSNNIKILFDDINLMLPLKKCLMKAFECTTIQPKTKSPNFYINIETDKKNLEKSIISFKKEVNKIYIKILIQNFKIRGLKFLLVVYKIFLMSNPFGLFLVKILKKNSFYNKILKKLKY